MAELTRLLSDKRTGVPSLGVVEVGLSLPVALCDTPEESHLGTQGTYIAVVTNGGGVVAILFAIAEAVTPRSVHVLTAHGEINRARETMLPEDRGI